MAAALDTREQELLYGVKGINKELQKLSSAPQGTDSQHCTITLSYDLVRPNDELLQLLITDAFSNSKWKKIYVDVWDYDSTYGGDETTLCNAIFRGLSRNPFIEEFILEAYEEDILVSIPCLPSYLRKLELVDLDLREDAANDRKGLPELIQHHKHLNYLKLCRCRVCPEALGKALCVNESVEHLIWNSYGDMKGFFDSANSSTLQTLALQACRDDELGVSGIEAMQDALREQRLTLQKLGLYQSLSGENEVHAVARMLKDYMPIKELDLSCNGIRDDGVQAILSSLQGNTGLRSINLSYLEECTPKSYGAIKDFVESRHDGTLERVLVAPHASSNWPRDAQKEIDTLLDINKLKPLIAREGQGVPLSVLQHERLDCRYFYIRSRPEVCLTDNVEEPPRRRQKTGHDWTSGS